MSEKYKPTTDSNKPERKEDYSVFMENYKKEMEKIVKIKEQIARIEKTMEDEKIREGTPRRIELEENMAERQRDIQEAQRIARFRKSEHEHDFAIKYLRNLNPDKMNKA